MDDTAAEIGGDVAEPLAALAPRDALEAMLAEQMAAVHAAAMRALERAAECKETPQIEALYLRQAARLLHLFTRQLEARDKRRLAAEERAEQQARAAYFLEKEQREEEERQRKEDEHLKRWGLRPRRRAKRPGGRGNGSRRKRADPAEGLYIPDPMPG
jgi:hypothetical protein